MRSLSARLKGIGLIAGMVVSGLNVAIGAPLAGMLVASRATGDSTISMFAALMFCVVAAAVAFVFVRLLAILGAAHDRLVGRDALVVRRHVSWMRSMSGEPRIPTAITPGGGADGGVPDRQRTVARARGSAARVFVPYWFPRGLGPPSRGAFGQSLVDADFGRGFRAIR